MARFSIGHARRRWGASPALIAVLLVGGATTCSAPTSPVSPVYPQRFSVPAWSANNVIAYVDFGVTCVLREGTYQVDQSKAGIWLYDVATASRFRFLSAGDHPAWDPSGELLTVVQRAGPGYYSPTNLVTYDMGGQVRWTMPTTGFAISPSWSLDGQYIAWDQPLDAGGIWVAHRDSLIPRRLVDRPGYATWHPAKLSILHIVGGGPQGGARTVFREADLATGVIDTLFVIDGYAIRPYSPDGTAIVCDSWGRLGMHGLGALLLISSSGKVLATLPTPGGTEPAWSPDGSRIAYVRYNALSYSPLMNTLWRYELSTGGDDQLVPAWPNPCSGW